MSITTDERNYNEEVVFSPYLIAQTYGTKLPVSFDLNNPESSQGIPLYYGQYNPNNILISQNYFYRENEDFSCFTSNESCDIGLTGIDNGLVDKMSGETIYFTNGLFEDSVKFNRMFFDRRLKLHQVRGYSSDNFRFSGLNKSILYEVVSKEGLEGKYHELYGGFYQGFYKLFGYDYEILPERVNKGWTVEMILKPRLQNQYTPLGNETTLNELYPNNKNTFFYLGTRSENKFYHHADGEPISGYTRITSGLTQLETCSCCLLGAEQNSCLFVYPPDEDVIKTAVCQSCTCGEKQTSVCGFKRLSHCDGDNHSIQNTCETDPIYDSMSNALSFRLCGDPKNPSIGVKVLRFTGDCTTTGTCSTEEIIYQTGYTITEYCTEKRIYDYCYKLNPEFIDIERWFMINVVWERYITMDECDLRYKGGLSEITKYEYLESLIGNTTSLIGPEYTHSGATPPGMIEIVKLNEKWLEEKNYRMGRLKIYVNGKFFDVIENFEEIIPRGLDTEKEKQLGVPFNISWGGGSLGLIENLTFSSTTLPYGPYVQDPECLSQNILSGTTLSGLSTNMLIEPNFAGTFEGGISQFRMYVEPLDASEIKHNFKLLVDSFAMLDPDCPDCYNGKQPIPPTTTTTTSTSTTSTTTTTTQPIVVPRAYLFIEPQTGSNEIGQWMFDSGSNFFGFTNNSSPSMSPSQFNFDMNKYVDFEGWSNGTFPGIIEQVVPQSTGGFDNFGNPIVKYNFKTTEVKSNTVSGEAWYTWIIPTILTDNQVQSDIDVNVDGDSSTLTTVGTEDTISQFTFTYSGNTIPNLEYRVYTTYPNKIFKINNTQSIYFKGNSLTKI
jgi:hypothetical protein